MRIELFMEHQLGETLKNGIADLLLSSFDGYPKARTFYHQLPTFRYLGFKKKKCIFHVAIDHRVIRVGEQELEVWALIDFCVEPSNQNKGIGKEAMAYLKQEALQANIDFLVLTSDDSQFYERLNFERKDIRARWVMIHQRRLFGIQERTIKNTLYVLPIHENKWPEGTVDFMGTMI